MLKQFTLLISLWGVLSIPVHAAFDTPNSNSNGWGGWTRGDTGTLYAEWDLFNDYPTDSSPDVGSFNTTLASITETTGGAFITGGGAGNIYSFAVPTDFDAVIEGAGPTGLTQVAMQIRTLGTELDLSSVLLNALMPDATIEILREPFGGSFGGDVVETLFIWDLVTNASSYAFDFSAVASSMSLDRIAFDVGPSPIPVPAAVWMFLSGILGFSVFSRKRAKAVNA